MVSINYWEEARPHPFPSSNIWKICLYGARSRHGAGVGIVLISPAGEESIYSFRLEFDCTNNVAEYEALLLGLEIARDMKIKCLSVIGDFDLVVSQVRNQFAAKNDILCNYRNAIWDAIEIFDVFSIK